MLQYLVFLGAAVNLWGASVYIRNTLKGQTKPNRVTWMLWAAAPMIATAAGLSKGVGLAVLPVFMSGFCPLLVFLASFVNPKAYWQLTRLDYACGALSILALVLWAITKEASLAIIFAILSDGLAALPTVIKCWTHPETESWTSYATGLFNALTCLAAVQMWTFVELAFPAYLIICCSLLLAFVYFRRESSKPSIP